MTNASELLEGIADESWSIVRYGDGDSLVIHYDRSNRVCFMATPSQSHDEAKIVKRAKLTAAAPDLARQVVQLEAQLAEVREVVSLASRTLKIITGELEQAGGGRSATADDVIGICDALLTKEPK